MLTSAPAARAFHELHRHLRRRRWALIDWRLRLELPALGLLIVGFLFWQVRVPLHGVALQQGPAAAFRVALLASLGIAAAAAAVVAARHARMLRLGPGGPEWLALPVPRGALRRHWAWESRVHALWLSAPAIAVLLAAFNLVEPAAFVALVLATAVALPLAGHAGALAGGWWAGDPQRRAPASTRATPRRGRFGRWRRAPRWLALWHKDRAAGFRRPRLVSTLLIAGALAALSIGAWSLDAERPFRHFAALLLGLLSAGLLAEWMAALSGLDPFITLRALPLSLGDVWWGRFAWALLGAGVLVVGHTLAARELSPDALRMFVVWLGLATLGIGALAVNYGVTLFPRADLAQRLLGLSLGLAVAASIMLPLSGWVVLAAGVIHSARRLPLWDRLEEP